MLPGGPQARRQTEGHGHSALESRPGPDGGWSLGPVSNRWLCVTDVTQSLYGCEMTMFTTPISPLSEVIDRRTYGFRIDRIRDITEM